MSQTPDGADPAGKTRAHVTSRDVARGAGSATLARLGALIEVVSQPAYTWMFGLATYGLYTVLWSLVNMLSNVLDLAMTSALQRVVPQADGEERAHAVVKMALLLGVLPSLAVAAGIIVCAEPLSGLLNVAPADAGDLVLSVRIFALALPLWSLVEVVTSAVRARRAFGPEIRLRLFWEQVTRLGLAAGLFLAGLHSIGLMVAHVASLTLTAGLGVRLLGRYYRLELLWAAPLDRAAARELLRSGLAILPANIIRRCFSDLPPVLLNLMLPGAAGATAAGLYGIARKVSSVAQSIRIAFGYVLAPLASHQSTLDRAGIQPLYGFAVRLSTLLVVPLAMTTILLSDEILRLFAPEARAARDLLIVLTIARALEAVAGPATALLEVIGRRVLPAMNSVAGLALWLMASALLVPPLGALGMGLAVGIGMVVSSYLSVFQLIMSDSLRPFAPPFGRTALAAAMVALVLASLSSLLSSLPDPAQATVLVVAWLAGTWLALRLGLAREDVAALGRLGAVLRLRR